MLKIIKFTRSARAIIYLFTRIGVTITSTSYQLINQNKTKKTKMKIQVEKIN